MGHVCGSSGLYLPAAGLEDERVEGSPQNILIGGGENKAPFLSCPEYTDKANIECFSQILKISIIILSP